MLISMFLSQLTQGVVIGSGRWRPERLLRHSSASTTATPATASASEAPGAEVRGGPNCSSPAMPCTVERAECRSPSRS